MVGFYADFFWVGASPFDYVFEGHYFSRLGFISRASFVFGSSVLRVFLRSSLISFSGMFSAFRFMVASNSGSDHLPMSSRILAAGVSSPVSSALNVASSVRFVSYFRALTSTVVEIFLPALARRIRFLNCVAASVVPETFIFASVRVSIPLLRVHLSRSPSWTFTGAGSKTSHSGVTGPTTIGPVPVGGPATFPHSHGHLMHFGHKCPLGSVSPLFPASSGRSSSVSELIVTRMGGFSGVWTLFCWMSTHVPFWTPSSSVFSNRDWFSGSTVPAFLCVFS